MPTDSVYLNILEMYLCLFLPSKPLEIGFETILLTTDYILVDAEEFRLLLMPMSNTSTATALATTTHNLDPRVQPMLPMGSPPK